jgi:L-threonylcarbamoyladenylate synthase
MEKRLVNMSSNKEIIKNLTKGNSLLCPSDTIWGISCDATNPQAVKKIYKLKQREESKALICLVSDIEMLKNYVENLDEDTTKKILNSSAKPTTIIYNNPKNLAENLVASDNSVAIRIAGSHFLRKLIKEFGKPIVSTSANISGKPSAMSFEEIEDDILKGVDYVVNLQQFKSNTTPSRILKLNSDGSIIIIRE